MHCQSFKRNLNPPTGRFYISQEEAVEEATPGNVNLTLPSEQSVNLSPSMEKWAQRRQKRPRRKISCGHTLQSNVKRKVVLGQFVLGEEGLQSCVMLVPSRIKVDIETDVLIGAGVISSEQ